MYSRNVLFSFFCAAVFVSGCNRKSADSRVIHREGEPDVINVDSEDAEMNDAIAQARQTTDTFLQILTDPKPNQTDFSVKRPYPTKTGGTRKEHIWISHLSYDGRFLHGTVGDEPVNISNLKSGEPVSFPLNELSDWMYLEDGKIVGGYTIRVLRKHMPSKEAADFDRHFQFKQ